MYNEVKLQFFFSMIIFLSLSFYSNSLFYLNFWMKVIWSFFCRKNRSRALPVQVEENTFEDCPSFSRIFCFKYKFIYLPRCMMKNKEETPIKPIIREKMLKLQYPRSWNLSKYKYFLKIGVGVFLCRKLNLKVSVIQGDCLNWLQACSVPKW